MSERGTVGMIGCGHMGHPMALSMAKRGLRVVAYDKNSAALDGLAHEGIVIATSAQDLADRAETVLGCLPSEPAYEDALFGEHCVLEGRAVKTYVHLGTTGPGSVAAYGKRLQARGIETLDAPISGGVPRARTGTLTSIASGARAAFDRALPAMNGYSAEAVYLGPQIGAAQVAKLVNNLLSAANLAVALEGLMVGAKAGLDIAQLIEVLRHGTGQSVSLETKVRHQVLPRTFDYGSAFQIIKKDLEAWRGAADDLGMVAPVSRSVHRVYMEAIASLGLDEDMTSVTKYYEALEGVRLPALQPDAAG